MPRLKTLRITKYCIADISARIGLFTTRIDIVTSVDMSGECHRSRCSSDCIKKTGSEADHEKGKTMSRFSMLTAEFGRLALDLANSAYSEGRKDEAEQFVSLAFTIFEQSCLPHKLKVSKPESLGQPHL